MRIRLLAFFAITGFYVSQAKAMEDMLLGMHTYGCPVGQALETGRLTDAAIEILLDQKPFAGETTPQEDAKLLSRTLSDVSAQILVSSLDGLNSLHELRQLKNPGEGHRVKAAERDHFKTFKTELEKSLDSAFYTLTGRFLAYILCKEEQYKNLFEGSVCTYSFSDLADIGRVKRGLNYYDNGRAIQAYQNLADLYFSIRHPLGLSHTNTFSFESVPGGLTLHVPAQSKKATDHRFMVLRDDYDRFVPIWFTGQTGYYSNQIGFFEDGCKRSFFVNTDGMIERRKGILAVDEPRSPLLGIVVYHGWDKDPKKTYVSEIFSQSKWDAEGEREIYQFLKPLMPGTEGKRTQWTEGKRTQYIFLRPGEENFQGLMNVLLNSLSDVLFMMNKLSDITQQESYQSVISGIQSILMSFLTEDSASKNLTGDATSTERQEKQKLKASRSSRVETPKETRSEAEEVTEAASAPALEEPISQETLEILPGTRFEIKNEDMSDFSDLDSTSASGEVSPVKPSTPRRSRFLMPKPRIVARAEGVVAASAGPIPSSEKVLKLTKNLLESLPQGKRLKVREYMELIDNWIGGAGLEYTLTQRGSHRVLHIPRYGSITIVEPHGKDSVPVDYAKDIAEEIAAASVATSGTTTVPTLETEASLRKRRK